MCGCVLCSYKIWIHVCIHIWADIKGDLLHLIIHALFSYHVCLTWPKPPKMRSVAVQVQAERCSKHSSADSFFTTWLCFMSMGADTPSKIIVGVQKPHEGQPIRRRLAYKWGVLQRKEAKSYFQTWTMPEAVKKPSIRRIQHILNSKWTKLLQESPKIKILRWNVKTLTP